jgi:hypothetical protein
MDGNQLVAACVLGIGFFICIYKSIQAVIIFKKFKVDKSFECFHEFEKISVRRIEETDDDWGIDVYTLDCIKCKEMKTIAISDNGDITVNTSFAIEED